ncbi:hypothetical protein DVQ53_01095 [Yersinia enterocolitica]|nr:hypothetical protein [Yersinia enterocolitica]
MMANDNDKVDFKVDDTVHIDISDIKRQRDAANKARKEKKYVDSGFSRTKIYLGKDTYEKLAAIFEDQRGSVLNIEGRKDIDSLSRVISYCINKVYKEVHIKKKDGQLADVTPAFKAKSQELYDLYQAASFMQSKGLSIGKIMTKMNADGYPAPNKLTLNGSRNRLSAWTEQQVRDLLDLDTLNKDLNDLH